MRRTLFATVGLCLTVAACGSTVPLASQGSGRSALSDGLSDSSGLLGPSLSSTDPGTTAPSTSGPVAGQGAVLPGSTPAAGATTGSTATSGGATATAGDGSAVSAVNYNAPAKGTPVEIGIMYIPDLGAAAAQFGGDGTENTDQRGYMQAAADYITAHGGLGGHPVKMVYYPAQIAGAKSYADSEQEYCAMLTQDHHVVAGIIASISVDNLAADCLNQKKVMYVSDGGYLKTTADWSSYPYMISPSEIEASAYGRALANLMITKGAARSGDTVGIISRDYKAGNVSAQAFIAVAKAHNIKVVQSAIHYATSTPDLATTIANVQSAELAMKARGAVTIASLCGSCMGYFMKNAESQKYYPRYVFSSYDSVVAAPDSGTGNQLRNAIAVGWQPMTDVNLFTTPSLFSGDATYNLCRTIEKKKSVPDVATLAISQRVCQALLLIHAAAKAYGGTDISGTTLLQGANALGTSYLTGATFSTKLAPSKHWAPVGYRSMHYDYNAGAFVYDSAKLTAF